MSEKSKNISTKDLSYISDMFQWNVNCYNAFNHFKDELTDEETKTVVNEVADMHKESCEFLLGLINE